MPLIRAEDLEVGDLLKERVGHGILSIKRIDIRKTLQDKEVVVFGPLGIVDKIPANTKVTILNDRKKQ